VEAINGLEIENKMNNGKILKTVEKVVANHRARLQGKLDWEKEIAAPNISLQYGITVNSWDESIYTQREQKIILEKAGLTNKHKRTRDIWDEEYDKGKAKKVKIKDSKKLGKQPNAYQAFALHPHKKFFNGKRTKNKK